MALLIVLFYVLIEFNIVCLQNYLSSLWGKLATEILTQDWENALDDLNRLKEVLDSGVTTSSPLQALQQRTWLIHWSLFVFFNHAKGYYNMSIYILILLVISNSRTPWCI